MVSKQKSRSARVVKKEQSPVDFIKLEHEDLPDVKFVLHQDVVQKRLATISAPPVTVTWDEENASKTISREFFSSRFGGSSQSVFPRFAQARKDIHDIESVCFMTRLWNPELPARPGQHGLAFCRHPEKYESMPLFVRKAEHQWQYMGEYRLRKVEPLTGEEWGRQSDEMRGIWLDEGYMKLSWGQQARARYVYRERHDGQDADSKEELAELRNILKSGAWSRVTRQMIEDALDAGTEQIHVCALECVAYREDFQRELITGFEGGSWKTFPEDSCRKRRRLEDDAEDQSSIMMDGHGADVKRHFRAIDLPKVR